MQLFVRLLATYLKEDAYCLVQTFYGDVVLGKVSGHGLQFVFQVVILLIRQRVVVDFGFKDRRLLLFFLELFGLVEELFALFFVHIF